MLERQLRDPEPGSLVARFADAPQTDDTRVVHQIPHMMFAMRDTLGANAYRALAAIVADPEVERRAREEIDEPDLVDPDDDRRDDLPRGLPPGGDAAVADRRRCSRARRRARPSSPARSSTRARR